MDKIKLKDAERARIRNSSTKRGFVVWIEWFPRTARGRREVRPTRSEAYTTRGQAAQEADRIPGRYANPVKRTRIFEVDHMGRVLAEETV